MPRDSAGNYTLPPSNPVVDGTTIEADGWANPTLGDIATALTNSLSRNGNGGMLVPLTFVDGSVGAPGIAWTSQTSLGFYRAAASDMRVAVAGADKTRWVSEGIQDLRDSEWHGLASEKHFKATDDAAGLLVSGDATETQLLVGGNVVAKASTVGLLVTPSTTGVEGIIGLTVADDNVADVELRNSEGYAVLRQAETNKFQLIGLLADGTSVKAYADFTYGGAASLYFDGVPALFTQLDGGQVRATTGDETRLSITASNGTSLGWLRANQATGGLVLNNDVDGGAIALQVKGVNAVVADNATVDLYGQGEAAIGTYDATDRSARNSGGYIRDAGGVDRAIGMNTMPYNNLSTTSTLTPASNGVRMRPTNSSPITYTLGAGFEAGDCIMITASGSASVTVVAPGTLRWYTGSDIVTGNRTLAPGSTATVQFIANSDWDIWGGGIS